MRASIIAEKAGIPSSSLICDGFAMQASLTAAGLGLSNLPVAAYPGPVNLHSVEKIKENVRSVLVDRIVNGLTVRTADSNITAEPGSRDIVFSGALEDVNQLFYNNGWTDGLPIIPPTAAKIEEFLSYTGRRPDEVIGVMLPDRREATTWNIAANGVMAGCRPEYMPVLVAIVEAMADPKFGQEHLGHTPGTEVLITINGHIIKDLGFNYEQGALRVGFQANTSIGRFWRLYLTNVAGFMLHKTDKGSFGGTWRVVLAENEDAVARIGWKPLSVDQGFEAGDNVVTLSSCTSTDILFSTAEAGEGTDRVKVILDKLAARVVDCQLYLSLLNFAGTSIRPLIVLSPCVAEIIANGNYSKGMIKQYLFDRARFPARRFQALRPVQGSFHKAVDEGRLPKQYFESEDPDRLVPIVFSPEDFMIAVSGDPGRDNCLICAQNGYIGYPVSKGIELPSDWHQRLRNSNSS